MGLHSGFAEPVGGEYATPGGAPGRPGRVGRARRAGALLRRPPPGSRSTCRRTPTWSTSACTSCAASTAGSGCSSSSPTVWNREFPRPRTLAAAAHNLPAPSASFVGRAAESGRAARPGRHHRLVTVVGPGGAGKTRLALEVAGDAVAPYADGVWLVDLAAVTDPYLVAVSVAEVLGVRPEPGRPILETIADYVAGPPC